MTASTRAARWSARDHLGAHVQHRAEFDAQKSRLTINNYAVLDIGGTSTKAAVIDGLGNVLASIALPTRSGPDGVVSTALKAMLAVAKSAGVSLADLDAVGVGIPGTVDPSHGTVRFAVNVGIGGDGIDLGARLTDQVGTAVHVENDVRAAALSADWYLATTSGAVDDLAYLSIGTGIAAGYVERGRVRRGNTFVAGEIGHIPIDPLGPRCVCGQIGCIEAMSSGSAIDRLWPTSTGAAAVDLHRAASAGDTHAQSLWSGVIEGLSRAVLLLALTWDPEVVVISGGVSALGEVLLDEITARLAADGRHSEFLGSLDLGSRMRVIDPSVPLGAIGAIRAAHAAGEVSPVPLA